MNRRGSGGRGKDGFFGEVLGLVARIPRGRVATYGQLARMAGRPGAARSVGWALHALPRGSAIPWHRVVNAGGGLSPRGTGLEVELQRRLLVQEGVAFGARGRLDLDRYRWNGRAPLRRKRRAVRRHRRH